MNIIKPNGEPCQDVLDSMSAALDQNFRSILRFKDLVSHEFDGDFKNNGQYIPVYSGSNRKKMFKNYLNNTYALSCINLEEVPKVAKLLMTQFILLLKEDIVSFRESINIVRDSETPEFYQIRFRAAIIPKEDLKLIYKYKS